MTNLYTISTFTHPAQVQGLTGVGSYPSWAKPWAGVRVSQIMKLHMRPFGALNDFNTSINLFLSISYAYYASFPLGIVYTVKPPSLHMFISISNKIL